MRIQLETKTDSKKEEQKADCCFRSSDNYCCNGCSVLLYGKVSGVVLTKKDCRLTVLKDVGTKKNQNLSDKDFI